SMNGQVTSPWPGWAVPGGVVHLRGHAFQTAPGSAPVVTVGGVPARVLGASHDHLRFAVPADAPDGVQAVRVEPDGFDAGTIQIARSIADQLHQVDSPAFDGLGRLYVTRSGSRGESIAVPLYRI